MRLPIPLAALIALSACTPEADVRPSPFGRFYYPTAVHHVAGAGAGTLFVASSNFDKRYDDGVLHAIDLDAVGLPAFPAAPGPIVELPDLRLADENQVYIRAFAGDIDSALLPTGKRRLFIPSRAEDSVVNVVDAAGSVLDCGAAQTGRRCSNSGPSLEAIGRDDGHPRALEPIGVAVGQRAPFLGRVFITHLRAADSPIGSGIDLVSYLVTLDAGDPVVSEESFLPLVIPGVTPPSGSHDVALGQRYAYLSGRFDFQGQDLVPLQIVDATTNEVLSPPNLQATSDVGQARGIAVNAAETRAYLVGRGPDVLYVIGVSGANTVAPSLSLVRTVPLPSMPNAVQVIERPGRGELVVVTATEGRSVAIYDADAGAIVREVDGLGAEPYGLAVATYGAGARLFVTTFSDGQVEVIDLPDLARPTEARRVAVLGTNQFCLERPESRVCAEESP